MRRRLDLRLGVVLATAVAALVAPASAAADYGDGAQIISADFGRLEQGDDTTLYATISDDARYVAFQTRARNFFRDDDPDPPGQYRQGGIFRFDLQTRGLELVADGDVFDEDTNELVSRGAQNPSVNGDGRYVAFSTAQRLVPLDTNGNVDVYVRDMTVPIRAAGAFDLVSARDGGDVPAAYAAEPDPRPGLDPGSEVTRGEAISADGSRIAFRSVAASDLAGPGTPPDQVLLRDTGTNTTTLVTRASGPDGGPAGGAAGPAAISGDGTTVAWTGGNAAAQTRLLNGENTNPSLLYYLWRRVSDGANATTRRITGVADVDDPACPPDAVVVNDSTATGPCYGPLGLQEGIPASISGQAPILGNNGRRVTFLTGSGPRGNARGAGLDLYSTDMSPGVSRKGGTIELTRESPAGDPESSSAISSVAMSADGRFIGLATVRTRFVLPALRFIGSARTAVGPRELYVADLEARTIERTVRARDGGDIDSDVADGVSLSGDAGRVAFTSLAGNIFFGDGNSRADAFVATRQASVGPAPPLAPVVENLGGVVVDEGGSGGPRLGVQARSLRDGRVELTIRVPGAGELKSQARARAPAGKGQRKRSRRQRTLAVSTTRPRSAGRTKVVLRVVRRYRRELRRKRRLVARVGINYVAARGGRRLTTSTRVTFRVKPAPKRGTRRPQRGSR